MPILGVHSIMTLNVTLGILQHGAWQYTHGNNKLAVFTWEFGLHTNTLKKFESPWGKGRGVPAAGQVFK